ncbi:MAG: valine--tRNA ligase, partial [Phycisphaerales bacterium]|nr:valine--tRNA ligase [Phycisphaerales bacterium]
DGQEDTEPPFCILIPPPNVTSALHLGHAFNNTLQDILVRHHRMRGARTLWMPGTDHAGIATQTVVEKRLLREGKRRTDFTRDEFIARVQAWKDEYEATIVAQLQEMGASCDFDRTRFTMDEVCATAVREAFYRFFEEGLIYRGKRLVNWDPLTRTALADDEVEMREVDGHMWFLRYPLSDGSGHLTVATTRPETMFGDTAVAMNPRDPRAEEFRGKTVRLPIVGREIPIVEDDHVVLPKAYAEPGAEEDPKAEFGTGFLKVTPAHDPNDWDIGLRHDLPVVNVMAPDGSISDRHGFEDCSEEARAFVGMNREEAREAVVAWFKEHDLLENVRDYPHSVGHADRSHVPIEPYLSDQWYVRVRDDRFAGSALRAMSESQFEGSPPEAQAAEGDGGLTFTPPRYAKTFQAWHENIRDWCISRQLWWGHRIPVWTREVEADADQAGLEIARQARDDGRDMAAIRSRWTEMGCAHAVRLGSEDMLEEHVCVPPQATLGGRAKEEVSEADIISQLEADGFVQDPDVLDTWFSSALWPLSTMGWPDPATFPAEIPEGSALLETFNPSSVLCTAREIITLWVSRMVMMNRFFLDRLPFTNVYIHAMIQDGHGQKMSKSLGNGVDPRDIISSHGADAMRFTLAQMATATQDVRLPVDTVCPHSGEVFEPEFIRDSAGYLVAKPIQSSPKVKGKSMVSSYGAASGEAVPTEEMPLALNTSSRFDVGRNFCNKLWNAVRFALSNLEGAEEATEDAGPQLIDRWIIARLHRAMHTVEDAIGNYQFNVYADTMYELVWKDFCDWYLEGIKPTVRTNPAQQATLHAVLDSILRMLHPVCPFVTETLWPHLHKLDAGQGVAGITLPPADLCAVASWPSIACSVADDEAEAIFQRAQALVMAIRNLRGERQVKPSRKIRMHCPPEILELVNSAQGVIETMAGIGSVEGDVDPPSDAIPIAFEGGRIMLSDLVDAVDMDKERARLAKVIEQKAKQVEGLARRLDNPNYVQKAKPELVEETRRMLEEAKKDHAAAEAALAGLG